MDENKDIVSGKVADAEVEVTETNESEVRSEGEFKRFLKDLFMGKEKEVSVDDGGGEVKGKEDSKEEEKKAADIDSIIREERAKWEKELEDKKKFESLSDEEQEKLKAKEKEDEIQSLKDKLLKNELRAEASELLSKDGYPIRLLEILNYSSREAMTRSFAEVTEVFKAAVADAVKERLKSKTPEGLGNAGNSENVLKDEISKAIRGGF